MAKAIVSDELWSVVAPLLPPEPPKPKGGRPRLPDRAALTGIIFVLRTGIPWEWLPQEMGCGSGMTCWRRLRAWQQAGVWHQLHRVILDRLGEQDRIDWSRASVDSTSVRAKKGAPKPGRTQPIGANQAPNATWWSRGRASPSPIRSRRRT
jgi:transposase